MKAIFVFAHPDDESFSCGGTIAKLARKGHIVKLITLTRGEAGQLGDPPICSQEELGHVRVKELHCSMKVLGINQLFLLGFKDGNFKNLSTQKIAHKIFLIFKAENPDLVITHNTDGGSRHPDHIKTCKSVTEAFKEYAKETKKHVRLYYGVTPRSVIKKLEEKGIVYNAFGKVKGFRDSQITTLIDVSETMETKIESFKCHQTQKKDWERILKRREHISGDFEHFRLILEKNLI